MYPNSNNNYDQWASAFDQPAPSPYLPTAGADAGPPAPYFPTAEAVAAPLAPAPGKNTRVFIPNLLKKLKSR